MIRGISLSHPKSKTPRAVLRYYPVGIFFCDRTNLTPSDKKLLTLWAVRQVLSQVGYFCDAPHLTIFDNKSPLALWYYPVGIFFYDRTNLTPSDKKLLTLRGTGAQSVGRVGKMGRVGRRASRVLLLVGSFIANNQAITHATHGLDFDAFVVTQVAS